MRRVRFSWRLLSSFDPHSLNDGFGSFDPAFGSSNVHRNPALLFSPLGAVASGVADRVAEQQPESQMKSALLRCCGCGGGPEHRAPRTRPLFDMETSAA